MQRIMGVSYKFPSNLRLSRECLDLISQIFVANPAERVTLKGLKAHDWFLQNLPDELKVSATSRQPPPPPPEPHPTSRAIYATYGSGST